MDIFFEQYKPASSIANYLTAGSKQSAQQSLGFELEHFVVMKDSLAAVPYSVDAASDEPSVERILEEMKQYYVETVYEKDDIGISHLFGLGRDKVAITLEPGSQLEVSIGPAHSIAQIEQLYQEFRNQINPILDRMGVQLLELGYHPTSQAHELSLLPKYRYEYMNDYFSHTGKHGICMMRATASTQVSVDFNCEPDATEKFRIANALGPFFAFLTDNTPVFEGQRVGAKGGDVAVSRSGLSVPFRMGRMVCWDDTDPTRSLIVRDAFDEDFSFIKYANILVDSPAIFMPAEGDTNRAEYVGFSTFKQVLDNTFIDEDLVLHILSLFFFDVRFKTYLELRQADSLPLPYALAYVALISGIFYNANAREHYSNLFLYTSATDVAFAKSALRRDSYEAIVYRRPATEWLDEMMRFAGEGLSKADRPYLEPLERLVAERKTVLDLLP